MKFIRNIEDILQHRFMTSLTYFYFDTYLLLQYSHAAEARRCERP